MPALAPVLPIPRSAAALADDSVTGVLDFLRRHLDMDVAWLSDFTGGRQVLGHVAADPTDPDAPPAGTSTDLDGSFCLRVLDGRLPSVVADARHDLVAGDLVVTEELAVGAYIGVPVRHADGGVRGMLCCVSHRPRTDLDRDDLAVVELLARYLGDVVERSAGGAARAALLKRVVRVVQGSGRRTVTQPIVDLTSGAVSAVEALTRFDDGTPDAWFADARLVGLSVELELACARSALELLSTTEAPCRLSLNLSPGTLLTPECAELLAGADRQRLVIEVTEDAPVDDYPALLAALAPHRAAGAQVAVDDAGAGYASFRHVLRLEPQLVKVDLTIIRDLDTDPSKRALVTAMQTLAGDIGAQLVAEGVETQAELATVRALGVSYAQGYLLGRPR